MLRILFVGQAVERKGLPLLLRAFEALREHIPTELTVIGPTEAELAPLLMDPRGVRALGKVDDATKHAELLAADVLAAPSLGGESFGMVLTEAFASGTTVVASDIAGYRDVVERWRRRRAGPARRTRRRWPRRCASSTTSLSAAAQLAYGPPPTAVQRFAWEHVALEVMDAYKDAIAMPEPEGAAADVRACATGFVPADLQPRVRAQRLESLERPLTAAESRRSLLGACAARGRDGRVTLGVVALAYLALQKIGIASIGNTLINSEPSYVLLGLATMCLAMVMRGFSWHAILQGRAAEGADQARATRSAAR